MLLLEGILSLWFCFACVVHMHFCLYMRESVLEIERGNEHFHQTFLT